MARRRPPTTAIELEILTEIEPTLVAYAEHLGVSVPQAAQRIIEDALRRLRVEGYRTHTVSHDPAAYCSRCGTRGRRAMALTPCL